MEIPQPVKPSLKKPGDVKRRAVDLSRDDFVRVESLVPGNSLPLVLQACVRGLDLIAWAANNRKYLDEQLLERGAILYRGFTNPAAGFEQFIRAVAGEPLEYQDRSSPRTQIGGKIYTSTDYPADQSIPLHNENSYSRTFPMKLFFSCVTPAEQGGETNIADSRKVFRRISSRVRDRFVEKKVMYVRNFGDGFGLSWQVVFQTTEKSVVEDYCRANGIRTEWKTGDRLRTSQVRPAIAAHPQTGELVWFNHAVFFHISTLDPMIREGLLSDFAEADLPNNTYYGDGSAIESSVLEELREAYERETVPVRWKAGDCLALDNMLTAHGRASYAGHRQVIVGMAESFMCEEVQHNPAETI